MSLQRNVNIAIDSFKLCHRLFHKIHNILGYLSIVQLFTLANKSNSMHTFQPNTLKFDTTKNKLTVHLFSTNKTKSDELPLEFSVHASAF